MASKLQTTPLAITKVDVRPKDLKRIRLIKAQRDFSNNPAVISAALDALEREGRQKRAA